MPTCLGHVKDGGSYRGEGRLESQGGKPQRYVLQQSVVCIISSCLLYHAEFSIQWICNLVIRFLLLFLIIPAREKSAEERIMVLMWVNDARSSKRV
jgi:hypothetical protein